MASALAKTTSYQSTVNVKLTHSGTMMYETGASQFYAKRSIVTIPDNVGPEEENRRSSINLKKLTPLQDGETRFPKLADCAHFHYEFVDFGELILTLDEDVELDAQSEQWLVVNVSCNAKRWTVRRTYESLYMLDKQLHRCIYDRKFSMLPELTKDLIEEAGAVRALGKISAYLNRFSILADCMINCGPILCWMEMDNHGKRLMVPDTDAAVNIPAVGAAHAVRRYVAQSTDEISFEVGDILSIIDNPPSQESTWWRGKKEFEVGYFPSDHVELIGTNQIPPSVVTAASAAAKPVLHKRKVSSFLVGFFSSRPSRTALKQTGIVKERVFGCDLGEHLLNSGENVPLVLKCCAEVLEKHGIVDGIYRLCGVASNLQKLRNEFDENRVPDLTTDMYLQDIHCISSMVKMYFRELPNPLLTYQLYDKFTSAISEETHEGKVDRLREVVRQLPPPHFRTAEFLFKHLSRMASFHSTTSMHHKNLAIVWAPNLLRSKLLDQAPCVAALSSAGLQAVVTEFLIGAVNEVFDETCQLNFRASCSGSCSQLTRPKSVGLPSSGAKLLSLEEAQERALGSAAVIEQKYFSVGEGPAALTSMYHTVIELRKDRKKNSRRSAINNWRSFFSRTHSMTLPSSLSTQGKFSDMATNDSTNPKEGDSLKRVKRTETAGDSDSTGDLVDGKRRSISLDVIDSTSFDRLTQNISQSSSSKADAVSADVNGACFDTIRSFQSASVVEQLMSPVETPFQTFPGRPHRIDLESLTRSPLPSFRKGSRVTPRPLSESSPTEPEKMLEHSGQWPMPAVVSIGSCGSDKLFFEENHFETPGCSKRKQLDSDYNSSRMSSSVDNSRQSVSSFKPALCSETMQKVNSRLPSSSSHLYRQPLEQNNLCENREKSNASSSSDCTRRLLSDEQEFLAWKLSGSSGSRDLLSELSPAISRVMPKTNYVSSTCDDSVFCSERTESPDMYASCQSLSIVIPADCDIIGSIPDNIDGLVGEDENDETRFSSLVIDGSQSNIHSRQDFSRPGKNQKHRKSLLEHGLGACQNDSPLDSAASLSVDSGRVDETCFSLSAPFVPKRSAVSSESQEINWKSSQTSSFTEDPRSLVPLGSEPSFRASKSPGVPSDGGSVSSVDRKSSRRDRVSDQVVTPAQSSSSSRPPVPIRRSIKEASKPKSTQDSPSPAHRPECLPFQKQHSLKEQSKSPSDDVFFDSVDVSRKSRNSEYGSEQQTDSLPTGFLINRHRQSKTSSNSPVVVDKEFGSSLSFSSSSASSRSDLRSSVSRSPATERAPGVNDRATSATPLNSTSSTDHQQQRRAKRNADSSGPISASEFFSESENSSSAWQGGVDSPSSDCAVYAEILRTSSSRRSHPPVEVRGKPSAGAYTTRAGAPVCSANVKPESHPSGNSVGSFKERRKVFEKAVMNSSSSG